MATTAPATASAALELRALAVDARKGVRPTDGFAGGVGGHLVAAVAVLAAGAVSELRPQD